MVTNSLNWMTLSLFAAFCWGMVNVLDREMLLNSRIQIRTRQLIDSFVGLVVASLLLFKLSSPTILLAGLGMLSGVLVYFFNYLYYRALKRAGVSAISVYLQSIPVFSSIIGFVFFAERFHSETYLGMVLVFVGAVLVGIERTANGELIALLSNNMRVLLRYMLPASLIMSINYGLCKVLLTQNSFFDVFFWGRIGFASVGILVYGLGQRVKEKLNRGFNSVNRHIFFGIVFIELIDFMGMFLLTAAYEVGTITLVSTVVATQPLVVIVALVFMAVLSHKEPLRDFYSSPRVLGLRIMAVILQMIGIFLLSRKMG